MSDDAEWGPWIDHDGKGCPCVGKHVRVKYDNGQIVEASIVSGNPQAWDWSVEPDKWFKIASYRIRKPRALLDLISMVENLPVPAPKQIA